MPENQDLPDRKAPQTIVGAIPPLTFNTDDYRQYFDGLELTEQQRQELLGTLWCIIVQIVDLGFRVHPIQQASETDGKTDDWNLVHILEHICASDSENDE